MKKNILRLVTIFLIPVFFFLLFGCKKDASSGVSTAAGEGKVSEESFESKDRGKKAENKEEAETSGKKDNGKKPAQGGDNFKLLYHLSRHSISSNEMQGETCYTFNFYEFLDAGIINQDGTDNEIIELKDYPTSLIASKKLINYFYISSPGNPVTEMRGYKFFNWDVGRQTLYLSGYDKDNDIAFVEKTDKKFPGGVLVSPENKYLVYLMTDNPSSVKDQSGGVVMNKFNPFLDDSDLLVKDVIGDKNDKILKGSYNRQLFSSFCDFSDSGQYFYTIKKETSGFKFIRVSLDTAEVEDFSEVFTYFDWGQLNWDEFFPPSDDYSYAYFSLSPDEERLVAYKNQYSFDASNPCYTDSYHKIWVFNLEDGSTEFLDNKEGYVSDITWEPDGQKFALAIMGHSGCYPDYLDARIDVFDKNGRPEGVLIAEDKSKMTNIDWSPDGKSIAYDIYSTDLVGRLMVVDIKTKNAEEIINTADIDPGFVNKTDPVTILLTGWVAE